MKSLVLALAFFASVSGFGGWDHSHAEWSRWLKTLPRKKGAIDYQKAKAERSGLDLYIRSLGAVSRAEFDAFSTSEKAAFLVNAYNAFTLSMVLDHYPLKSIKKLGDAFSSPWNKKFFNLFASSVSLDEIEHQMIRKELADPRVKFSLANACRSCPQLSASAFTGDDLAEQIETATKQFLSDPSRNRYDAAKNKLSLSEVFKWYSKEIEKVSKDVPTFVATYLGSDEAKRAKIRTASVSYLPFDWSLNDAR